MNPWTLERLKPFNLPRINGPLRHDAHQLGNSQCLGLYQGAGIGDINTKLGEEHLRINLGQQLIAFVSAIFPIQIIMCICARL